MSDSINQSFFDRRTVRYLSVLLAALAAYFSVLGGGFVYWDDSLITGNLALRGFSTDHLLGILVPGGGSYQPVRNLTLAIIYHFFKLNPLGYLLVNLILYLLSVALAYRVLEALEENPGGGTRSHGIISWIGAALFALHPLHVEAVAWTQGIKDLLVTVFFLGAFLSYLKYRKLKGTAATRSYISAYFLFILALGSKPSAAAFPLVILAYDFILHRSKAYPKASSRLLSFRQLVASHLPYWIPAILLAFYFIFISGAMHRASLTLDNYLVLPKILWSYYRLILLPVGLMHRYPDPLFQGFMELSFLAGLASTAAVIVFLVRRGKQYPLITFGVGWFYLCWLPQSGIIPIAIRVADRYIFLSLLGVCLAIAVILNKLYLRCRRRIDSLSLITGIIVICAILGTLSAGRCLIWRNGETLWSDAVNKKPFLSFYIKGLANVYLEGGDLEKAFKTYSHASRFSPGDPGIWTNMGYIRKKQGRLPEALELYRTALAVDSTNFTSYNSMGNIYAQSGDDSLATAHYLKALEISPGNYMATSNLAGIYRITGRKKQADSLMAGLETGRLPQPVILLKRGSEFIEEGMLDSARLRLERALVLDPDLVTVYGKLGEVMLRQDSLSIAINCFRRVLKEAIPDWALFNNIALAYSRQGLPDSACVYYSKAHELEPDSAESTINLAVVLKQQNRTEEAVILLEDFLKKHSGNFLGHYNLGQWLAKDGFYTQAAEHYSLALRINPDHAGLHLFLGQIYLQYLDKPDSALAHFQTSLEIAPNQPLALSIRRNIDYLLSR
jgi:protein O-mannosyl-transferase